jgi:putative transposase
MYKPLKASGRIRDKLGSFSGVSPVRSALVQLGEVERKNFSPPTPEANARNGYLHQLSTEIAKSHGIVKMEKLKARNMTASAAGSVEDPGRNVKAKSGLNRSILDQGLFADMLGYKLPERGGERQFANPAYTSQCCPARGVVDAAKSPVAIEFVCTACGYADNADVAGRTQH